MSTGPTSPPARILIVDDAPEIVMLLEEVLGRDSLYELATATTGPDAVVLARQFDPDVVILDLSLPGLDGVEVCRELRAFTDAYVLMLSGRDEEVDRLVGLAVGADDYMTKPFSSRELAARIQVLLRRPRGGMRKEAETEASHATIVIGDLSIDPSAREVRVAGEPVELTKLEFELLATLASRPEMVFTRELLVENLWGPDWHGDDHMVSVHIANLRKKIDRGGFKNIKTVRGVGYRMQVPDSD